MIIPPYIESLVIYQDVVKGTLSFWIEKKIVNFLLIQKKCSLEKNVDKKKFQTIFFFCQRAVRKCQAVRGKVCEHVTIWKVVQNKGH